MAEIFSVCQAFSIVELSRLVVVKDLDDIADLLVVEMKLSCFFVVYDWHIVSATQNMFKYTQTHREIEVLTNTSYCFIVYVLTIAGNTLLTGSCTLHSR